MTPNDTKTIYERACRARRMAPQEDEGRAWHRVLRDFDVRDVEAGLDGWWASTERDRDGDLRSKWLPAPAELKPLVVAAQRRREAAVREPKDFVVWECRKPEGCGYSCSGWVKTQLASQKNCQRCGKPLYEVIREKASQNTTQLHVA